MPGIIVSRPIFNTLFKLAHDEGLSINAFLTRLLETASSEGAKPGSAGRSEAGEAVEAAVAVAEARQAQAVGVESTNGAVAQGHEHEIRPIGYDNAPGPVVGPPPAPSNGRKPRGGNPVWDKVVSMEGRRFSTSRGKKFTYKVTGEYIVVRDSQARIPRSQFDKAQKMWPVSGPSRLVGVYAPSVVWAVMKELFELEQPAAIRG